MGLLMLMGDSGFRGALDTLTTGLESAWSVGRRLRAGYSGPIIRVRRSSDNSEQDFSGSGASGAVDASAVAAFCGAGDGFLTTIYDQSGNGRNLAQSTTTVQPLVVASGVADTQNGKLWARFNGATSSRRMSVDSSTATYKFLHDGTSSTLHLVLGVTDDANIKNILRNVTLATDPGIALFTYATEQISIEIKNGTGNICDPIKSPALTTNQLTVLLDADNATAADREEFWRDGTVMAGNNSTTGTASSANANNNLFLGTGPSGSAPFNGAIGELVIWSQNQTASRTAWEANAKTFWGTP